MTYSDVERLKYLDDKFRERYGEAMLNQLITALEDGDQGVTPYTTVAGKSLAEVKRSLEEMLIERWRAQQNFPRRLIIVCWPCVPLVQSDLAEGGIEVGGIDAKAITNPIVYIYEPEFAGVRLVETAVA